ncbi:MAG TPA: hypothetical protein VJV78_24770 [Polyangiales bacterium]|nr:hypothetical protein [Polyangiales bacterium]
MHAVVLLACGLFLCACFDSHGAEAEPAPPKRRDEPAPSKQDVPETPDGLDWHAVYFVRRTAELPECGAFQVAALGTPQAVRLRVDCWADSSTMRVAPSGAIYYLALPGPTLYAASCDEDCRDAPATRGAPVDTPACDAERRNELERVLLGPDGDVIYECADQSWYDELGHKVYDSRGESPTRALYLGRNRRLLAGNSLVDLDTGEQTEIRGLDADPGAFRVVRSARDGFWVVTWEAGTGARPVLWRIDPSGAATRKGTYPTLEADASYTNGVLDSDGALYSVSHDSVSNRLGSVVRRTISGELRVALDASGPTAPLFETLITGP